MSDIYQEVARIQTLAYELVQKFEEAVNKNELLAKRMNELQDELTSRNNKLLVLEKELKTAKIAKGMMQGEEEPELAKAKISSLVREIDRCIALLNE